MSKCCGTCKWWAEESPMDGYPRCRIAIDRIMFPQWMAIQAIHLNRDVQQYGYGTDCMTYEAKQ